jgi:superoxide dismutase, Cu-Zn family
MNAFTSFVIVTTAFCSACTVADDEVPGKAVAMLMPTSAASTVTGSASFTEIGGKVTVNISISGASPGVHGLHIHAGASCDASTAADGTVTPGGAAAGHWNPGDVTHGDSQSDSPNSTSHAGDIGNITIQADGTGKLTYSSPEWAIKLGGAGLVAGHAMVFHANPDDLMTQPTGNAGGRQACGVIAVQ